MALKNTLKRIAFYGTMLAALNYFSLPLVSSMAAKGYKKGIKNKEIQQVCQTDQYLEDILSSIDKYDCEPIQLLKAAHAITSKKLDLYNVVSDKEEKAIKKGKADCTYFSIFTYSNYLHLAEQLGRPSLKEKVRLNLGLGYSDGKTQFGHVWLQVFIDGEWHNYETTKDLVGKNERIDFKRLEEKIPDEKVLDNDAIKAIPISRVQDEYGLLKDKTNYSFSVETGADLKSLRGNYLKNGLRDELNR